MAGTRSLRDSIVIMLRSHPCGSVPSAEVAYTSAPLVAQKDAAYQGLEEERGCEQIGTISASLRTLL